MYGTVWRNVIYRVVGKHFSTTHIDVVGVVADVLHAEAEWAVHYLGQGVYRVAGRLQERHDDGGVRRENEDRQH